MFASSVDCKAFFKDNYAVEPFTEVWRAPTNITVNPIHAKIGNETITVDEQGEFECNTDERIAAASNPSWNCWGMQAMTPNKYYAVSSSEFDYTFFSDVEDVYVMFISDIQDDVLMGSGALKLFEEGFDQDNFDKDTPYWLKYGPEVVAGNKTITLEITWNGMRGTWKLDRKPPADGSGHLYRFHMKRDGTYGVHVDWHPYAEGHVEEDFEFEKIENPLNRRLAGVGFETYMVGGAKIVPGFVLVSDNEDDTFKYGDYIQKHLTKRNLITSGFIGEDDPSMVGGEVVGVGGGGEGIEEFDPLEDL